MEFQGCRNDNPERNVHPAGSRQNETFSQQGADTQHRRLQESLQGTNRDHKFWCRKFGSQILSRSNIKGGKCKRWWKQETYKGVQEQGDLIQMRKWWRCCTLYLLQRSKRWSRQRFTKLLFLKTLNNKNLW